MMLFFLLLACEELVASHPKIIKFFASILFPKLKLLPSSKQIPYPTYLYFDVLAFLVIFAAPNKQFWAVKSVFLVLLIESKL